MKPTDCSIFVKNQAQELGFDACGIAEAGPLPIEERSRFTSWLQRRHHAEMGYMEHHFDKRTDPTLLLPGCQSVVVVALNYFPQTLQRADAPQVAKFAYGKDYHNLIRSKLRLLLKALNEAGIQAEGRAFADSAPIAERFWAVQAGLGWIGKNNLLIMPGMGSYYFLGILLTDLELTPDAPMRSRCGRCSRCLDACPTRALKERDLDARRCLSCLTIEKKGPFQPEEAALVTSNKWIFGCDTCQDACPWNRFATENKTPELQPRPDFVAMGPTEYANLDAGSFKGLFRGTCLERTGLEGLKRNLKA